MATLKEKLLAIQTEIKAPKNLYNSFGGFSYRNAEAILETAKPILKALKLCLVISDEVVEVAGRPYVKAVATISETMSEIPETITVTAFARIPDSKKGMDDAQLTGAASSYARKYALNGLFLLDDNKDADSDEYHDQTNKPAPKARKTPEPKATAALICEKCGKPIGAHGKASASQVAEASKKQFGQQMCYDCAHAEKEARESGMTYIDGLPFPTEG